ncbi:MAG TPA: M28 family peptidase [Anaerolineales bacterium]|nr:M28 family peptidase [Anaerolineales bacterium]HNQ93286.1 M28 family peptidase [Anaerolineales bacterium]HNS59857.1 M28 family peptidase [Anaerolineales bacterium]
MTQRSVRVYLTAITLLLAAALAWYAYSYLTQPEPAPTDFDGFRAYEDVKTQVAFGPRTPGSEGHAKIREWMRAELESAGWEVDIQASERLGNPIYNLVAMRGDETPQIILGAHYDSRIYADNDPEVANHTKPTPGANDGASGVAVVLELARSLPGDVTNVALVFFDAEDNGRIEGWDWILGSREFVENIAYRPNAVVIVDMIGDADLNIFQERNSDSALTDEIWAIAGGLGYGDRFVPQYKHSMLDDHTPFLEAGIPAVDIIDFDYPYWHTVEDTPDKVTAESLAAVGQTLWVWVVGQNLQN